MHLAQNKVEKNLDTKKKAPAPHNIQSNKESPNIEKELKKLADMEEKLLREYKIAGEQNNIDELVKIDLKLKEIELQLNKLLN